MQRSLVALVVVLAWGPRQADSQRDRVLLQADGPEPGELCATDNDGRFYCGSDAYCSTAHDRPTCTQLCYDTTKRLGKDIPRKMTWFCDYGDEEPIKKPNYLEKRLPEPGEACSPGAMTPVPDSVKTKCKAGELGSDDCYISEGCAVNAWCNLHHGKHGKCYERCFDTKTTTGDKIKRNPKHPHWCDYGGESPKDILIDHDHEQRQNMGEIGDRCIVTGHTPHVKYHCEPNAWCHEATMTCYEACHATPKLPSSKVPRMDRYGQHTGNGQWCDYGGGSMWTRLQDWLGSHSFGISVPMLLVATATAVAFCGYYFREELAERFLNSKPQRYRTIPNCEVDTLMDSHSDGEEDAVDIGTSL